MWLQTVIHIADVNLDDTLFSVYDDQPLFFKSNQNPW